MLRDFLLQACPIPTPALRLLTPQIKLQLALACGRAFESLVWAITSGKLT